jgi:23S rRNA (pseudouridine1915-N3)-methyltransferase
VRVLLIAASNRQPSWVEDGFREYARRLRGTCTLELKQLRLARRTAGASVERALADEGTRMLSAVPSGAQVVALTESGSFWSTAELAGRLQQWMARGAPVCLLIGGPDGLSEECLTRADERWSLSPLTLPHGLARIVTAEALYRAWSLTCGHPYHRA